jgi:histidine phosphotransferase ChpT
LTTVSIAPLDLAALLCSRVCHDVISPVGAIVNGLEVLDGEEDPEMREIAMDLIKKSAASASARIQFCRLAVGAAGSLTASIDTGDAENVARGLLVNEKTSLRWNVTRRLVPKNIVKLCLNLCLIGAGAIPRGGVLSVSMEGGEEISAVRIVAESGAARLPHAAAKLFSGEPVESVDAHTIQPYYAVLLAEQCRMQIRADATPEGVTLTAALAHWREDLLPAPDVSLQV